LTTARGSDSNDCQKIDLIPSFVNPFLLDCIDLQ
jgi:hypothetical protein